MNDLYIHQLETENKQIREQLQLCRNAVNEIKEELNKTIDAKDKIINEQVVEIAHLNLQLDQALKDYEELLIKTDKAIELLKNDYFEDGSGNNINKVLEILGDKE